MNKYFLKIASDIQIATASKQEEDKAIHDYTNRLQAAKSPELKSAISHALKEEKVHSRLFGRVLEKISSLEKQSLNALKARSMAKSVGIIPDHTTNWKYGLRNMRDSKGNPFTGKDIEKGRVRLGGLSNNAWGKLKETQTLHPDNELGFYVNKKGDIGKVATGSKTRISYDTFRSSKHQRFGHTHQSYAGIDPAYNTPRVTNPSGLGDVKDKHPGVFNKRTMGDAKAMENWHSKITGYWESGKLSEDQMDHLFQKGLSHKRNTLVGRVSDAGDILSYSGGRDVPNSVRYPNQDISSNTRGSLDNIANTTLGVDSVHKSVGLVNRNTGNIHLLKHRTVRFQHD